jgi:hypothetical protein
MGLFTCGPTVLLDTRITAYAWVVKRRSHKSVTDYFNRNLGELLVIKKALELEDLRLELDRKQNFKKELETTLLRKIEFQQKQIHGMTHDEEDAYYARDATFARFASEAIQLQNKIETREIDIAGIGDRIDNLTVEKEEDETVSATNVQRRRNSAERTFYEAKAESQEHGQPLMGQDKEGRNLAREAVVARLGDDAARAKQERERKAARASKTDAQRMADLIAMIRNTGSRAPAGGPAAVEDEDEVITVHAGPRHTTKGKSALHVGARGADVDVDLNRI